MGRRIAVIEDDDDLRDLIKLSLQAAGYEVVCYSGVDTFPEKDNLTHEGNPGESDLYIIDLNLGGASGLELCRTIKAEKRNKNAIIIIMSANPEVRKLATEACADDAIEKPFSTKDLLNKVSGYLSGTMAA